MSRKPEKEKKQKIREKSLRLNSMTTTISDQDGVGYGFILDPEKL
jgi:hypothetical protein